MDASRVYAISAGLQAHENVNTYRMSSGSVCRRLESDFRESGGRIGAGYILVMLNRADYWQIGYIIAKGGYQKLRSGGSGYLSPSAPHKRCFRVV